jgi:Fe2+ or Zn2+ uptake regulation protein
MPTTARPLRESLARAGYKVTAPRRAVLQSVARMRAPLTVDEILSRSRRAYPRLGLVTVYRTLEILRKLGHVRRLHMESGCHTYAAALSPHGHYLICSSCGRAVEFSECHMQGMLRGVAQRTGYRISTHWLELFGRCPRCQKSRRPRLATTTQGVHASPAH